MIKTIIVLTTLFLTINVSAQTFKKEGLRIVTQESLSETQTKELLAFNFEDYREQDHSSVIKIQDGPTIELFSISEMKTGIKPKSNGAIKTNIEIHHHGSHSGEPESAHYKELNLIKVKTITVFNSTTNAVK